MMDETTRLLAEDSLVNHVTDPTNTKVQSETKVYKRRWYILILFSLFTLIQCTVWNSWGPISQSARIAFGFTEANIALLTNWGPIAFVVSTMFSTWIMDVKGLRIAALSSMLCIVIGTSFRCISSSPSIAFWLINIGHILNGFASPLAMAGAPLLSAVWFPVSQRATATSLVLMANSFGFAVSFLLAPALVPDPYILNNTQTITTSFSENLISKEMNWTNVSNSTSVVTIVRENIMRYMCIDFGFAAFIFILLLIYFPARPPLPPSLSASVNRMEHNQGFKLLFRNKGFWVLALPYSLSAGIFYGWLAILAVNLEDAVSQNEAGWIGFYSSLSGSIFAVITCRFADYFSRQMKSILVLLFVLCSVCFTIFSLGKQNFIPFSSALIYSTCIIGSICLIATVPLFFELVSENTYPIAEGLANGLLTGLNALVSIVFLFIVMIHSLGTDWMNWTLVASCVVSIPIICSFRVHYSRLDIDSPLTNNPDT